MPGPIKNGGPLSQKRLRATDLQPYASFEMNHQLDVVMLPSSGHFRLDVQPLIIVSHNNGSNLG